MAIKTQPYTVEHVDSVVSGLHGLKAEFENRHLTELFAEDPQRFEKFSVNLKPVVFDFSKHRVNQPVVKNLVQWARTQDLTSWIKRLFSTEEKLTIPNSVQPCIGRYGYPKMISLILN